MYIKEVLKKHNISQTELAERLGINRVTLAVMLSDRNDIKLSTIKKIADAVGCKITEFFVDPSLPEHKVTITCPHCGEVIHLEVTD